MSSSAAATQADPLGPAEPVVHLRDVTKVYGSGHQGIRWRAALPGFEERVRAPLRALDGLTLDVRPGEAVGIIGPNGAGKSTALKVVAGLTRATSGTVEVHGTVRSMIELGIGFHPELTGWENVWCGLVMYGYRRDEIRAALDEVADFAGIRDAMDTPLKHFSLGMRARLAFAVATHTRGDVLVVDEVLSVGDRDFQLRCIDRIGSMLEQGTGLLFVSHEMPLVAVVCQRVVHLRHGRVADDGPAVEVVERYLTHSPSRYRTDPNVGVRIERCADMDDLEPWGTFDIELQVAVSKPLREPKLGIDVSMPTLVPDVVSCSSLEPAPALGAPGTYLVRGHSTAVPGQNAQVRLTVSVIDGIEVGDVVAADCWVGGDQTAGPQEPAVLIDFTATRVGDDDGAASLGRRSAPVPVTDPVVRLEGVTKRFHSRSRRANLRAVAPGRLGAAPGGDVVALSDVTLEVGRGQALGLIGANGAGKSTLLRAVAGLHRIDEGRITAAGRIVPMLDPSAGLHAELTGRENIARLGAFLGMGNEEIARATPWIEEFAGLGPAIDRPVLQYSSGMRARLALAIALSVDGDVLLIDELLAVGDEEFRLDVLGEVSRRVAAGLTVLFVSHELRLIEQICDRVVRLERGRVVDDGVAAEVIDAYGGMGWGSGVRDATSGVRLQPLRLRQRHIALGGRFHIEADVVVEVPTPTARLEVAYRSVHGGRPEIISPEYRAAATFLRRTLEPAGGLLARAGRYAITLDIDRNGYAGEFDVVVAVVDERDQSILTETWQEVMVGEQRPEGFPGPVLEFDWTVSPLPG